MMMKNNFASFSKKLEPFYGSPSKRSLSTLFSYLLFRSNIFFVQLSYFLTLSLVGYLALSVFTKPRTSSSTHPFIPNELDLFFTSVSAATVSSMSTIEMEVLSNSQLIILTILMLLGGEAFISMLGIQIERSKFPKHQNTDTTITVNDMKNSKSILEQIELYSISHSCPEKDEYSNNLFDIHNNNESLKNNSVRYLGYVVLGYLILVHLVGSALLSSYISLFSSAREVLNTKGIKTQTFSVFTIVSTFANCGFVPTNENVIVFKRNSGLLLILISQILLGNTLYPVCLRLIIWSLGKITKRREFGYLLRNCKEIGYDHLLSSVQSTLLALTVFGFILVQLILFCSLEWNSEAMDGMTFYQKFVAALFQVVNSRHAGESVVDISTISSAILVLFVVMMYLPPYTSFFPINYKDHQKKVSSDDNNTSTGHGRKTLLLECFIVSPLSYLSIFVILISITERKNMKNDPLNFNVLNVIIEVVSAYGNVGFSTGYSCKRRLQQEGDCTDRYYGFSGKWSSEGKFILIIVMFFGRLKKFSFKGGKAWKLS
ncbi:sodium transporter HKT1 [Humulus lupulus]|uniref:sodium transporter HKT1 n=1 Tax=Humulus lupulus TaxID=3486 RepID=UPI002B408FE9|nr:sodium transporter HKT1 [Humulus lupulus]